MDFNGFKQKNIQQTSNITREIFNTCINFNFIKPERNCIGSTR